MILGAYVIFRVASGLLMFVVKTTFMVALLAVGVLAMSSTVGLI